MPHVDDAWLHAYLDGELRWSGEDGAAFERHLERCAGCLERLEEAKRLREHGRSLLGGNLPIERPPFETVLRRARGGAGSAVRRRGTPGLWAAGLVLALAGGWLARGILGVGSSAPGGEGVQVSSAPDPERPGAAVQTDTQASLPPPALAAAEQTPSREPPVEGTAPRSAEPGALAVQIPPVIPGVESELPAVQIPPEIPEVESELLAAQIAPGSEEGGRIGMIEGRVTDESGRVIPGAVVQVRGLAVGTLTRPDGTYSLEMPKERAGIDDGLLITAAALGWESATQPLSPGDDRSVARDFRLRPAQVALEGIVAVGFGSASRTPRNGETDEQAGAAGWAAAAREEIRRLLGRDALRFGGMRVLETTIGQVDGIRIVRLRQELPDGAVCTLLQWADPRGDQAVSAGVAVAGRSLSQGAPDGTETEATAWRDGVRIVARAPLTADSLASLLETLQ